ncbi:MAG TPA: ATP-binding protein [Phycisphaerae bacterium]|nr:ATP-binding protein [Phycisphaerae bacterium]
MQTIQANVNPRLLSKASRLFTGSVNGRIIEILQNARRANATCVEIRNCDGVVTVHDNGSGISDFATLLDMGGSGWNDVEASEDPAGVGIYCLSPRRVMIRSSGQVVHIDRDGWTGSPVEVSIESDPCIGTVIEFEDELWSLDAVEPLAVFSGIGVIVDGVRCASENFVSNSASHHPSLGCRIEVRETADLSRWHKPPGHSYARSETALVNFHGQVVAFDYGPIIDNNLVVLVDLTGEPTLIRHMLPARTQLVKNDASTQLCDAIQLEVYRVILRRGHHRLSYEQYRHARRRGIELPEATPTYTIGLLPTGDVPNPVEVPEPNDFCLAKSYRCGNRTTRNAHYDEANAHILAALGDLKEPFLPVSISPSFHGYSWADLPTIERVEVRCGKELHRDLVWSCELICVESIVTTVWTSDGKVFTSPVFAAVVPPSKKASAWSDHSVVVTPDAETRMRSENLWHHLGGWNEDGDTYETQEYQFEEDLNDFWSAMLSSDERFRRRVMGALAGLKPPWQSVAVDSDGNIRIRFVDRTEKIVTPPGIQSASHSPST